MFKKSIVIKGIILLLAVGVLVGISWAGLKVAERKKSETRPSKIEEQSTSPKTPTTTEACELSKKVEKNFITKQEAINIANKFTGYNSPIYTNLIIYNPDPTTHYRVYDSEKKEEKSIYDYLEIEGKDLWIIEYSLNKNRTITVVIDAKDGNILKELKDIKFYRTWIDKIFKWSLK